MSYAGARVFRVTKADAWKRGVCFAGHAVGVFTVNLCNFPPSLAVLPVNALNLTRVAHSGHHGGAFADMTDCIDRWVPVMLLMLLRHMQRRLMLTGRFMQQTSAEMMHQTNAVSVFVRISRAFSRTLENLSYSSSNAPTCIVTWQQVTLLC